MENSAFRARYEEAQIRAAFTALDADQNGQIEFAEFSAW
jgi:Ca2+-binding EF-hand superfamily protein